MKIGVRQILAIVFLAVVSVGGVAGTSVPSAAAAAAAADEAGDGDEAGLGRMLLVLDSSGSMAEPAGGGQSKIEAARSALSTVIDGLPDDADVGLRVLGATVFSRKDKGACTDSQLVVPPGTDNRADLVAAVGDYKPYGETPIPYALRRAAKDLGSEGARSIVLVSDGESTCAPDPCEVAADLERGGIDLQIDVVGLSVSGAARDQLRCIAEAGNGHYYDADSAGDIESRLVRVASRAVRPFTLDGEPIEGGPEDDPTPITVGDWVDTIGDDDATRSYVFERTTAGSTLRASAVIQGRGSSDNLTLQIFEPNGDRCDAAVVTRNLDLRDLIGVEVVAAPQDRGGSDGACGQPGSYRITVSRNHYRGGVLPVGLRISEEPPITEPGEPIDAPEQRLEAPRVSGPAQPVEGGTSFSSATPLTPGHWSSTIVPGEALVYRVPVELGQALRVAARFPSLSEEADDRLSGLGGLTQVMIFNPMRAQLAPPDTSRNYGRPDAATFVNATPWVSSDALYVSRAVPNVSGSPDLTLAGDYYVMVSSKSDDDTVELPFTLDIAVDGEPLTGPTYADGETWSVAADVSGGADGPNDADGEDTGQSPGPGAADPGEESGAPTAGSDGSSSATPVLAGVAGVAGLGALVAALVLWRRRQAA